ncbi:hypothetical protein B0T18DRAFT_400834 [Schizothecium vesticola]|uniref:Uncharacterized protein n=1 Tax=Schizothecium vesticola TaxID=314040 RepID=A0AA40F449_9PEZI|nr:hypothetical protein B0T18DRAFT_400834 [Schizothecium vesticola]
MTTLPSKSRRFRPTFSPQSTRCLPILILTRSRLPILPTRPIVAVRPAAGSSATSRSLASWSDVPRSSGSRQTSSDKTNQGSCCVTYPLRPQAQPPRTNTLPSRPKNSSPSNFAIPPPLPRPTQS